MPIQEVNKQAENLVEKVGGQTKRLALRASIRAISDLLLSEHSAELTPFWRVSLMLARATALVKGGSASEAPAAFVDLISKFGAVGYTEPMVRHRVDLGRLGLTDCLLVELGQIERGAEAARDLVESFDGAPDDRLLSYKGIMVVDAVHLLLACGQTALVCEICTRLLERLGNGDELARSVAAEARFYWVQGIVREEDPQAASAEVRELLRSGEPGLRGLERVAARFGDDRKNVPWQLQVNLYVALVMWGLDRRNEAELLMAEISRRSERFGKEWARLSGLEAMRSMMKDERL